MIISRLILIILYLHEPDKICRVFGYMIVQVCIPHFSWPRKLFCPNTFNLVVRIGSGIACSILLIYNMLFRFWYFYRFFFSFLKFYFSRMVSPSAMNLSYLYFGTLISALPLSCCLVKPSPRILLLLALLWSIKILLILYT